MACAWAITVLMHWDPCETNVARMETKHEIQKHVGSLSRRLSPASAATEPTCQDRRLILIPWYGFTLGKDLLTSWWQASYIRPLLPWESSDPSYWCSSAMGLPSVYQCLFQHHHLWIPITRKSLTLYICPFLRVKDSFYNQWDNTRLIPIEFISFKMYSVTWKQLTW